jgi:hypothetical protein
VHVEGLVSVVKMTTVIEECANEKQSFVVCFLWTKGINAKDIHEEMFPVYGGKRFSTWSRKVADVSLMTKRLKRRCRSD